MHKSRQRKNLQSRTASIAAVVALAIVVAVGLGPRQSFAQDAQAHAVDLSDHAFSMLNAVNAASSKDAPMLAPAASLAGDAQALSTALTAHDKAGAGNAMAAVLSDRDKIEAAAKIAGGQYPEQWTAIRQTIAALQNEVPAMKGPAAHEASAGGPAPRASVALPPGERMPDAPKIAIASRVFKGEAVRLKGFLEGTDLKSAGIFDGDNKSKDIEVASVSGQQRINFDLTIEQPSPTQSIRVTDSYGREAQASVEPNPAGVGSMKGNEEVIEVDPGAATSARGEAGPIAESPLASAGPSRGHNTAEIPSSSDAASPSRRHIDAANGSLAPLNVQINVIDSEESMSTPGMVETVGQIVGQGVRHAGVYVNDRLVSPIAISPTGYSAFDVTFRMPPGSDARIRAYGNGSNFVEASIDTTGAGAGSGITEYGNPPMYPAPYGAYPPSPYGRPNPYAYANPNNPYAPGYNPYAPNPYGYPPPYGTPPPRANVPWWQKLFR